MDPQFIELLRVALAPLLTGGGAMGFYLMYRKFDKERADSLREDNKTLREENRALREELRKDNEQRGGSHDEKP